MALTWLWTRGKTKKARVALEAPADEAATTKDVARLCVHRFSYLNRSRTEKEIETMSYHPNLAADDAVVFPILTDSELAVLEALGTRRSVVDGDYLYREGDLTYDFYVILSGAIEVAIHSDGEEWII